MNILALDNENRTPLKSTEELLMIVLITVELTTLSEFKTSQETNFISQK